MKINLEFSGGLELLFDGLKQTSVVVEDSSLKNLFKKIESELITQNKELFLKDEKLRPGILVLVNESDWELEGQYDYQLKDEDTIVLISTLHGG
ncbi:Ubiquitin- modifier 1 [Lobulomyces angularis]|nr:Ubiquitin- modifier 1 [Lobulomyces angularis]